MKKIGMMLCLLLTMMMTGCKDDAEIIFHNYSGTYTVSGDMKLNLRVNGLHVTDTKSGVKFSWSDGDVAQITLVAVVEGQQMVVGAADVKEMADGKGLEFQGAFPISDTEKVVFSGTIIGFEMTLNVDTVPITA